MKIKYPVKDNSGLLDVAVQWRNLFRESLEPHRGYLKSSTTSPQHCGNHVPYIFGWLLNASQQVSPMLLYYVTVDFRGKRLFS